MAERTSRRGTLILCSLGSLYKIPGLERVGASFVNCSSEIMLVLFKPRINGLNL